VHSDKGDVRIRKQHGAKPSLPVWRFFSSLKLAIILLILLASASILGTLIPQGRSDAEYAARYGVLAKAFLGFQLTRLYHSFWYLALLFLFGANIIVCTLARLTPKIRRVFKPRIEADPASLLALRFKDKFTRKTGSAEVLTGVRRVLRSRHYRLREKADADRTFLLARRRTEGLFGSDVVHFGLLVILAGGIVSGLGGFKESLSLSEGVPVPVPGGRFEVNLEKFETEYYPDGSVRDWKSTLTVLETGRPVLTKVVEVNHPLSYKGWNFYQSAYGWNWESAILEIRAKKKSDPSFSKSLRLRIGETAALDDAEATQVSVSKFIPDFVLDETNKPRTRSLQPNNPAVFIEGRQKGEPVFSGWIFARYPDFARMHSAGETDLAFELKDYEAGQYSVIEAAKDPGVSFIWAGCLLLTAGLFLAFYRPPREIRIILEDAQGKTQVTIGAAASKSPDAFAGEFEKITAALRESK
jgi:cytochrome c biogenesis protein